MAKVTTNITSNPPKMIKAHFGKETLKQDYPIGYFSACCNQVALEKNIDSLVNSNCYQMKDVNIAMTVKGRNYLKALGSQWSNQRQRSQLATRSFYQEKK